MTLKVTDEQKKDIQNAKDVLGRYKYHLHRSRQLPSVGSPSYDGMPKAPSHGNTTEDQIIEHVVDPNRKYCDECKRIINLIKEENEDFYYIIKMYYFGWSTKADIQSRFNYSDENYYDNLKRAQLVFGESINKARFDEWEHASRLHSHD